MCYNTQVPTIWQIGDTIEVPQVQFIDKDAVDVPVEVLVESGDPTCPLHRKDRRSDNHVVTPSTNHPGSTEDGDGSRALSILIE